MHIAINPPSECQIFPPLQSIVAKHRYPNNQSDTYLERYREVLSSFWQTAHALQQAQANLSRYTQQPPVWIPSVAKIIEVCQSTIMQCCHLASVNLPLGVYFGGRDSFRGDYLSC